MQVWYVSYGSNLSRSRFDCYLAGGTPAHAGAPNPGARDPSPPAGDVATTLPGTVWFASWSRSWGGAVAFYDDAARRPGQTTLARAYLLTLDQLLDVAAQELGLAPGTFGPDPPGPVPAAPTSDDATPGPPDPARWVADGEEALAEGRSVVLDPGRYGVLLGCAPIEGLPAATLTTPWRLGDEPPAAPSAAYLRTIAEGMADSHGLAPTDAARYLAGLPGAEAWDAVQLTRLLGG